MIGTDRGKCLAPVTATRWSSKVSGWRQMFSQECRKRPMPTFRGVTADSPERMRNSRAFSDYVDVRRAAVQRREGVLKSRAPRHRAAERNLIQLLGVLSAWTHVSWHDGRTGPAKESSTPKSDVPRHRIQQRGW